MNKFDDTTYSDDEISSRREETEASAAYQERREMLRDELPPAAFATLTAAQLASFAAADERAAQRVKGPLPAEDFQSAASRRALTIAVPSEEEQAAARKRFTADERLSVPCPNCKAEAGKKCTNYIGRNCGTHRERGKLPAGISAGPAAPAPQPPPVVILEAITQAARNWLRNWLAARLTTRSLQQRSDTELMLIHINAQADLRLIAAELERRDMLVTQA